MSKAVLISINPEWCDLILRGEKTAEVRKTCPKLETPFKVYIYCTKAPQHLITIFKDGEETMDGEIHQGKPKFLKCGKYLPDGIRDKTQMVIGEFTCSYIAPIFRSAPWNPGEPAKMCARCADGHCRKGYTDQLLKDACLNKGDIEKYFSGLNGLVGYGWRISDLKIYDKPKELSSFSKHGFSSLFGLNICGNDSCEYYKSSGNHIVPPTCAVDGCCLKRPPQSWCYVEELHT